VPSPKSLGEGMLLVPQAERGTCGSRRSLLRGQQHLHRASRHSPEHGSPGLRCLGRDARHGVNLARKEGWERARGSS
jgi:hypothetical protein